MSWRAGTVALLLAAASACSLFRDGRPYTVQPGPAEVPPAPPEFGTGLRVLHLGDFGDHTDQQAAVAGAAAALHVRSPFVLALFAGDLIYECGPDPSRGGTEACAFAADGNTVATPPAGPPDPAFARLHEAPLAGLLAGTPVRTVLALGNHDVYSNYVCGLAELGVDQTARRKACLSVAHTSPLWSLPARHYVVDEGPARLIVLDSNTVYADYGGFTLEAELAFLAGSLEGCDRRSCFVLLHHPPVTAGEHEADFADAGRVARVAQLQAMAGTRIRAWLAGHDHDLQHLRTSAGIDVLVSGNGSRARPGERFERTANGGTLLFASTAWGLGVLTVREAGWDYHFQDQLGTPLHCCAASGGGPCQPVRCPAETPR